ncbi:MAG: SDR family oxidoreductase [Sphingomonadales bacterium]|nr:SDR family oxidoreductase [Sphingomonadales bacterium]
MGARRVALLQHAGGLANPCIARRLARAGHDLVLHAPRPGMVEELLGLGAAVEVIGNDELGPGSDTTPAGCQILVDRTLARFSRLDAAALIPPRGAYDGSIRGRLLDAPLEHVGAMGGYLEVTSHILRAVIPAMRQHGGQILVFTSDAGARPEAGWSLYGAARAGQNFLIRAAALEHAAEGIQLNAMGSKNAITAGFPYAPPGAASDSEVTLGDWAEPLLAETPLGRLGTMEELAAFAISLLDGSNRFQTAQYFSFSGGWSEL